MKLFTTKKAGLVGELIHYIPRIIYLIIILSFFYLLISYFQKAMFERFSETEQELFFQHVLHSPTLLYYDPIAGSHVAGMFDINTFTTDRLEQSYKNFTQDRTLAAELILYDVETNKEKRKMYYKQETYERWYPLGGKKGKGTVLTKNKMTYVLYVENGELKKGWIYAFIIVPKS